MTRDDSTPIDILNHARDIGRLAAEVLMRHYDRLTPGQVELKTSHRDLLTVADSAAERLIIDEVQRRFPDHGILGEEHGHLPGKAPFLWVIDPIDGTTNYARSFPFFACSIGVLREGIPVAGVVNAPRLGEEFAASLGGGATLNGKSIRVSSIDALRSAILATGFSYNRNNVQRNNIDNFSRLVLDAHDLRRPGAASLDLCYVAAGRFDGYWEPYLKPWDVAAGALIVAEAGGRVTGFHGETDSAAWMWGEHLVSSNGHIHDALCAALSGPEPGYLPALAGLGAQVTRNQQ